MIAPTPEARLKMAREEWQKAVHGKIGSASAGAKAVGIPKGSYLCLENGWRSITWDVAQKCASRFRVTPEWILSGRGTVLTQPVNKVSHTISIVYASDASAFRTLSCGNYLESEKNIVLEQRSNGANGKTIKRLVGVEAEDDAMSRDKTPSFGIGAIIIFDPDQDPKPGRLVWAYIASRKEPVIREYTRTMSQDGGAPTVILKAYNQAYEAIPFDPDAGDEIGGVYDPQAPKLTVYMQA